MKNSIQRLLGRRMERSEFLMILGMMALSLTGIMATLNNLNKLTMGTKKKVKKNLTKTSSFGSGVYGV